MGGCCHLLIGVFETIVNALLLMPTGWAFPKYREAGKENTFSFTLPTHQPPDFEFHRPGLRV